MNQGSRCTTSVFRTSLAASRKKYWLTFEREMDRLGAFLQEEKKKVDLDCFP